MPVELIVEDGTGLADANSMVGLDTAFAYHTAHGNTAWTAIPPSPPSDLQKSALIRGSSYIGGRYNAEFPGTKLNKRLQAQPWPRRDAYDADGETVDPHSVPIEIVNAVCEAALREYVSPGSLLPDVVASSVVVREKVDVLEVQYASTSGVDAMIPTVSVIDDILAPLIGGDPASTTSSNFFARA